MKKHSTEIDVLRGFAILGVISIHSIFNADQLVSSNRGNTNIIITAILNQGKYGVELFFFISGWLLNSIYSKKLSTNFKPYWIKRVARIYPLWIIFALIGLLRLHTNSFLKLDTELISSTNQTKFLGVFVLTILFLTFIFPYSWNTLIPGGWSIQSEMVHYFVFRKIVTMKFERLLIIYVIMGLLTFFSQFLTLPFTGQLIHVLINSWLRLNLFSTIVYFYFGILYSKYLDSELSLDSFKNKFFQTKLVVLVLLASLIFLNLPLNFGHNIIATFFIAIIMIVQKNIHVNKINTLLASIGKYSYFIYFSHFLIIKGLKELLLNNSNFLGVFLNSQIATFLVIFIFSLLISFILGLISFALVEKPIIDYGKRLANDI